MTNGHHVPNGPATGPSAARPVNPLAAKPGRLYVVMCNWRGVIHYMDAAIHQQSTPEQARKFSTLGDAECWIDELAGSVIRPRSIFAVAAFDDPNSTDAWLADMHQRGREYERAAWVNGNGNGHVGVGA